MTSAEIEALTNAALLKCRSKREEERAHGVRILAGLVRESPATVIPAVLDTFGGDPARMRTAMAAYPATTAVIDRYVAAMGPRSRW